jgi:hypothetical protein
MSPCARARHRRDALVAITVSRRTSRRRLRELGTPCIDPVLDGGSFVTEAFSRGRSVSA